MTSDEPLAVVALPEGEQGLAQLLDRAEVLHPEELFFKGTDEALSAAVPLWFPHEGRAAGNPQEAQLGLEVVAHELAAMIMPQGQPRGELFAVGPEVGLDALPQGFQSFEAGAAARRMNAYALRSVVVHGDEDGGGAFVGPAGGRISRSTRPLLVRIPASRRRAHTLRYPSPTQGDRLSTSWICAVNSASVHAVLGPRFCAGAACACRARTA